jgi:pimeloyl-ACP methyl ester carboxylesterase
VPAGAEGAVRVDSGLLHTTHVRGPVSYSLIMPASAGIAGVDAVAYVLPGRGGTANGVASKDGLGFAAFLGVLLSASPARLMLATLDAGESYFHRRTSGEDRLAAVTVDLAKHIRRLAGRPLREALIGQSMGGYGALLAAEREPMRFRSVAVAGPALFGTYADERAGVGDAFDDAVDFARNDVVGHAVRLRGVAVMVRCGDKDPFAPAVRAFASRCPSADVAIVPGCHTDGFWRSTAGEMLRFTAAHV